MGCWLQQPFWPWYSVASAPSDACEESATVCCATCPQRPVFYAPSEHNTIVSYIAMSVLQPTTDWRPVHGDDNNYRDYLQL